MENTTLKTKSFWFVARTIAHVEIKMRKYFEDHEIESFIPTRKELRTWRGEVMEVEIPVIRGLIFFKADYTLAHAVFYLNEREMYRICSGNGMLQVSDNQMESFIRLVNESREKVNILEFSYGMGDRVMVKKGALAGMTGRLARLDNKNYFTICLDGLLVAAIKFPKSNLVKVKEAENKSYKPGYE